MIIKSSEKDVTRRDIMTFDVKISKRHETALFIMQKREDQPPEEISMNGIGKATRGNYRKNILFYFVFLVQNHNYFYICTH